MNQNGLVENKEFIVYCDKIGYTKDSQKLWDLLIDNPSKKNITMADLDPAAMAAYWRGDLEAMSPLQKAQRLLEERKKAAQDQKEKRMDATTWPRLKAALIRRYGTVMSAWRR